MLIAGEHLQRVISVVSREDSVSCVRECGLQHDQHVRIIVYDENRSTKRLVVGLLSTFTTVGLLFRSQAFSGGGNRFVRLLGEC